MTEQTFQGFLLTRSWRDTPEGIALEFWFATDSGPARVRISGERSVFFLESAVLDQARSALGPEAEVQPVSLHSFSLRPVVAVYFSSHSRARQAADRLTAAGLSPLEADINPADRYLMERFVRGSATLCGPAREQGGIWSLLNPQVRSADYFPALKLVSLDIETAMEGLQLYSIAVHGSGPEGETRQVFMLGEGAEQPWVASFTTQEALLQAFLDWMARYDPDVMIGWNVINFDLRFLQRLSDQLGRRLLIGRGRRPGHWRALDDDGARYAVSFPGRIVLDGIELLRAAFYNFESFALDNVSRELLGEGKLLHGAGRGEEIGALFRENKTSLAEYNLRDCELVSEIFAATSLIDFALARSFITGLNPDRPGGSVASFDNLYLPLLHRRGYVAPVASPEQVGSPGGFVLDSMPGVYDHVLVLDFKSLYPSIILTFAIDPLGLALATGDEPSASNSIEGFKGARFAREGQLLPDLIESLWARRDAARADGNEPLSQAIKIIMNSFYGVLGSPGCRFFDTRLASSITMRGHEILTRTRDKIEAMGHRVIYGDTDSVFVWARDAADSADAKAMGRELQHRLNDWWRDVLELEHGVASRLELEFQTHFRRFLMPTVRGSDKGSKKRYAGLVESEKGSQIVFKGLENVRTDWTRLARDFQQSLYERVFMDQPYEQFVKDTAARLLAGELDSKLVYRKRLRRRLDDYVKNIPQHVQAARLYEARGLHPPSRGEWVEYVITTAGAEPVDARLAPLDYQHYLERQLQPVADGILGFLGTSFDALTGRQLALF